ncbi:TPA: hypothetical protein L6B75_09790 [Pseudomonas aeruginosa]|nr:hypothetical protein [Pseudomonas aeruginosa]
MTENTIAAYVKKADGDIIRVELLDNSIRASLQSLGFSDIGGGQLELLTADDVAKAAIFDRLRTIGVAFSAGKEWCPAEVFEFLRDQGLLTGPYTRIAWSAPAQYRLSLE